MAEDRCDLKNLTFPLSYFQDEVREGFYISTMMKRYFASQLKVLSYIAQICDKYSISWYADCGTLLGVIRHGGFIPWDDDLDICMLRDDWERFFAVAKKELPEGFQVLSIDGEPEYEEIIGRVVNGNSIDIGPERMAEYYGCPYVVGIDIFPLDGIYEDEEKENKRLVRAGKAADEYTQAGGNLSLGAGRNLVASMKRRKLLEKVQETYRECPTADAKKVALMPFYAAAGNHVYEKEIFRDVVRLPFDITYINAPARYEEVMEIEYGDYLAVFKKGGIHEYPVYAPLEEMLRQHLGHNPFRYTLDPKERLASVQRYVLRQTGQMGDVANIHDENGQMETGTCLQNGQSADSAGVIRKKQAVFLPVRACWWDTMEPLWKSYVENPEYEVHVLPIFYYDCDYTGAVDVDNRHDERSLFPEYVHVEDCEKYDFASIHPETIVIQLPYDSHSTAITVHEFFYSANLLNFTDELVYMPYLDMDAPQEDGDKASSAIKVFVEQEGVINADRIVISSDRLAEFYVNTLIDLTGKDTESYWRQKVKTLATAGNSLDCFGNYEPGKADYDASWSNHGDEITAVPALDSDWAEFLGNQKGKKVLVYHVSIAFILRYGEKAIEKIRRNIDIFREASDKICAILVPQQQILTDLERIDADLWREYLQVVEHATAQGIIYDEDAISFAHLDKWNGFYGDASAIVRKCVLRKIPVMIENVEV